MFGILGQSSALRMRALPVLVLAVALSGCFYVDSVLTVRPDGSATLRDEVTFSGMALMALAEDEETGEAPFGEDDLAERAATLGEGVRLASFERREDGFVAIYDVDDVRRLRYATPEVMGDEGGETGPDGIDLSFAFDDGDPATLRVVVPKPEPEKPTEPADTLGVDPAEQVRMLTMMRSFFADARVTVAVEVEGEIVETNASYVDGPSVTVFDIPFAAVFDVMEANPEMMDGTAPPDPAALLDQMREIEGVRLERPGTVRVRFR